MLVTNLLGREPEAEFDVVVRDTTGRPAVIRNAPFLRDGTPMPTRYWLVDPPLRDAIAGLEAEGGVKDAEAAVDAEALARAHEAYAVDRDAEIPTDHAGPRPTGGVGGARTGVKCLHAHYAYFLAGGADPVGAWIASRLAAAER